MDDLDTHLLARLRENARAPVAELARALGLSRTTVQSRLARLERDGVIAGYAVKLSEAREAALVHAFIMLTVEPKQAAAVIGSLKRMAGVRKLQS
ncbi:MAG: AsnC family transcriptional regulator, partial [Phenylobacterium sp.]